MLTLTTAPGECIAKPTIVFRPHVGAECQDDVCVFRGCMTLGCRNYSMRSIINFVVRKEHIFFYLLLEEQCTGSLVIVKFAWHIATKCLKYPTDGTKKKYIGTSCFAPLVTECGVTRLIDTDSIVCALTDTCCTKGYVYLEANASCDPNDRRVYKLPIDCQDFSNICVDLHAMTNVNDVILGFQMGKGIIPYLVRTECNGTYTVLNACDESVLISGVCYATDGRFVFSKGCKKYILFVNDCTVQFIEVDVPVMQEVISVFIDCNQVYLILKGDCKLIFISIGRPIVEEYILTLRVDPCDPCKAQIFKYSPCGLVFRGEVLVPGFDDFWKMVNDPNCYGNIKDVQIEDNCGDICVMVTGLIITQDCNCQQQTIGWVCGFYYKCGSDGPIVKCLKPADVQFGCNLIAIGNDFAIGNCLWANASDPCSQLCITDGICAINVTDCEDEKLCFDGCNLTFYHKDDKGKKCKTVVKTGLESCVFIKGKCACIVTKVVATPPGCSPCPTSSWREVWYVDVTTDNCFLVCTTTCKPTQCNIGQDEDCDKDSFFLLMDCNFLTHTREICIYKCTEVCEGDWDICLVENIPCDECPSDSNSACGGSFSWISTKTTIEQAKCIQVYEGSPVTTTRGDCNTSCSLQYDPPTTITVDCKDTPVLWCGLRCAAILFEKDKCGGFFNVYIILQNPGRKSCKTCNSGGQCSSCKRVTLQMYRCCPSGKDSCYSNNDCVGQSNATCIEFLPCDTKTIRIGKTSRALCAEKDKNGCQTNVIQKSVIEDLLREWCISACGQNSTLLDAFVPGCKVDVCDVQRLYQCDWPCDCPFFDAPDKCDKCVSLCVSCKDCNGGWTHQSTCIPGLITQCYVRRCGKKTCTSYQTVAWPCC